MNHALLLFFSLYLIACESGLRVKDQLTKSSAGILLFKTIGAFLLLEVVFIGLASVNLSDVAAGIFAAFAILGFTRKNTWLLGLAGGICVLVKAAYLYPILILVVFYLAESWHKQRREGRWAAVFFICIALQYWLTYRHTGRFSFLEPSAVKYWRDIHFASNFAGYDTSCLTGGHPWRTGASVGWATAFQQHQWGEIVSLIGARLEFYFSSFVLGGKVYISSTSERISTPFILVIHLATLIFSILYLRARAWRIALPLALILAQSLLLVPEQRFIFVIQLFLVMFTYLYFLGVGRKYKVVKTGVPE